MILYISINTDFKKNHLTEYAALHIVDYLYYKMNHNKTPINFYLDISKAFDCLSHDILLRMESVI